MKEYKGLCWRLRDCYRDYILFGLFTMYAFYFLFMTVSSVHIIICNHSSVYVMYNKDWVKKGEYTHTLWGKIPLQCIYVSMGKHFKIINRVPSKSTILCEVTMMILALNFQKGLLLGSFLAQLLLYWHQGEMCPLLTCRCQFKLPIFKSNQISSFFKHPRQVYRRGWNPKTWTARHSFRDFSYLKISTGFFCVVMKAYSLNTRPAEMSDVLPPGWEASVAQLEERDKKSLRYQKDWLFILLLYLIF